MQLDLFVVDQQIKEQHEEVVKCKSCSVEYPNTREYFHLRLTTTRESGETTHILFDTCKTCRNKESKIRSALRKKNIHTKGSRCECCNKKTDSLYLDHDHLTKEFRGWLCNGCNISIGGLGDSVEGLKKAIAYLTKGKK